MAMNSEARDRVDVVVAVPKNVEALAASFKELELLKWVEANTPGLQGDGIARKELRSRLHAAENVLETELSQLFSPAMTSATTWYHRGIEQRIVSSRAETPVELTAVEFNVLECLLRNAGSIVSRGTLAEKALGRPLAPFDRSVDVHAHNLRTKISVTPDERIKTIRGIGHMYAPPLEDVE